MDRNLQIDLLTIILEEAFGMRKDYAYAIAHNPDLAGRNKDVLKSANDVLTRFEAICEITAKSWGKK